MPVAAINFGWEIYRWKAGEFTLAGFESMLLCRRAADWFSLRAALRVTECRTASYAWRSGCAAAAAARGSSATDRRIHGGTIVALRFASDAELPALARKVLDEKLTERQSNQEVGKELEAGLPARLVANSP